MLPIRKKRIRAGYETGIAGFSETKIFQLAGPEVSAGKPFELNPETRVNPTSCGGQGHFSEKAGESRIQNDF